MIEAPRRVGATELRTIEPGTAEHRCWIDLSADAYPVLKRNSVAARDAVFEEERERAQREPGHRLVGAFRAERLVGGMRVYDFEMNVRGARMFAGGVGSVAVGLEHKQRGIARDLVRGFLDEYRARGAAVGVLHPFRPDFYRKLGFGYGAKMHQYRIALEALPPDGPRERVRQLGPADVDALALAYDRAAQRVNGLLRHDRWRTESVLTNGTLRTFGYIDANGLAAYLTLEVVVGKAGSLNRNALYVHELIYENPIGLAALLAFVRSQRDQFSTFILNTQDPDVHFIPADPRNGSDRSLYPPAYHETNTQGLGVMYRVIDVAAFVAAAQGCRFGELTATVRIDLFDTFVPGNAGAYAIRFERGTPQLVAAADGADVDLAIEVSDLSSLVLGAVRLRSLVAYGRAVLSNPQWLNRLDAAFDAAPPQCLTRF